VTTGYRPGANTITQGPGGPTKKKQVKRSRHKRHTVGSR